MEKVKKLFGGIDLTWKKLIIFAVIAGVYTAVMAMLPIAEDTSFEDITISFEVWILFGILIIMNSKSAKDSALKCFVFFLISQPLVYLVQDIINHSSLFSTYYRFWILWTVCTIPMGFIGYYMKKDKWWGLLILIPMLVFLGLHYSGFLGETLYFFPHHLLSALFCVITMLLYSMFIFHNQRIKLAATITSIIILIVATFLSFANRTTYNSTLLVSDIETGVVFDNSYKVYLKNDKMGEVHIEYDENLEDYKVDAEFKRAGKTDLILEDLNGNKTIYEIDVKRNTYNITKKTDSVVPVELPASSDTENKATAGEIIHCDLFSITIPAELSGTYETETGVNTITVLDKESKESGAGGNVFHLSAFKNPSEYAGGLEKKLGEMITADGVLYDISISYASDVQYDILKYPDHMPENYRKLRDAAEDIAKTIASADRGTFIRGQGTKGEELYPDILEKHRNAITQKWDASRLEDEEMSTMYIVMGEDAAKKTGYIYYDVNQDGIEELLIGEIAEGEWKGIVYDVYTMVDRKPAHVVSGWDRNRYYVLDIGFLCNEYSGGAAAGGWIIYQIVPNDTKLDPVLGFKYDGYVNEKNPWFISYNVEEEEWENVTEEELKETKARFENYVRFDYIPLFQ